MTGQSRTAAALLTGLLLTTAGPAAAAMSWRDANQASAAQLDAGNLDRAVTLAEEAANLYAAETSYNPAAHAQLLLNLVGLQVQTAAPQDLPGKIRRAMSGLEEKVGEDHPLLIDFWKEVAAAQGRAGLFSDAKLSYTRIIHLAEQGHGAGSGPHVEALVAASHFYRGLDGAGPARTFLTRAEDAVSALPPDDPLRATVQFHMAKLYLEDGDLDRAEDRYNSVLSSTSRMRDGAEIALRRASYGHLALLHKRRGDLSKMEEIIQRTAELPYPEGEPQPLVRIEPEIPPGAWRISYTGHAKVRFTISGEGRIKDVEILDSSGSGQFVGKVEEALSQWRYQPHVIDGRPVDFPNQVVVFQYSIKNEQPELGTRLRRR